MLEKLKKCLKKYQKNKEIFDIVVYGSLVKGKAKPEDIDIAVIFNKGNLKERLETLQIMKNDINFEIKVDMKGILINELFREDFFAKAGIFLEGISVFDGRPFSHKIGFEGFTFFIYNLKDKNHTEKVKFNYALSGRNSAGVLNLVNGKHIARGVIQVPIGKSSEFEDFLKMQNVGYYKRNALVQR